MTTDEWPPPPPTDWASTPMESSPRVAMVPVEITVTSPPAPPRPLLPPTLPSSLPPLTLRAPEKPPAPPPPPTDWASTPVEPAPSTTMSPKLWTVTVPPSPPPAPVAPTLESISPPALLRVPLTLNAPWPPPPPTDWANTP